MLTYADVCKHMLRMGMLTYEVVKSLVEEYGECVMSDVFWRMLRFEVTYADAYGDVCQADVC
jgi:predicted Rdx family selenoprotein